MCACRYNPQTNRWIKVTSMNTRRLGVGVAVLGGFLYAIGGSDGAAPLCSGMYNSHTVRESIGTRALAIVYVFMVLIICVQIT